VQAVKKGGAGIKKLADWALNGCRRVGQREAI